MSERLTMIEDYIPVEEISYESSREKVARRRNGHLSTLHLWWARRPLAASRAAVYATFAPPAVGEQRKNLPKFFEALCHWAGPILPERDEIRTALDLVSTAANGGRPKVLDMFAGGGAIPFEAMRLGAEAVAVDLNPVAHVIQLCTLAYPARHGAPLREAVEREGKWLLAQTRRDVGHLYPPVAQPKATRAHLDLFDRVERADRAQPFAYVWTRTVPSPARGFEDRAVPLVRQTWLRKKSGNYVALRLAGASNDAGVVFEVVSSTAKREADALREWGFNPEDGSVGGETTCPYSGMIVTSEHIKRSAIEGRLGVQLLAVACASGKRGGKFYLPAAAYDSSKVEESARQVIAALTADGLAPPDEDLPPKGTLGFRIQAYGFRRWGDVFTTRQTAVLLTMCKWVRASHARLMQGGAERDFADAVAAYLTMLVGRVADRSSALCRWNPVGEKTEGTFARPALPMVWDFSEADPFGGASGDGDAQLELVLDVLDHCIAAASGRAVPTVLRAPAQRLPIESETVDAVITDPPYYDNVPYADLSDFYYVWHKRALGPAMPAVYTTAVTPKKLEAIAEPRRFDGKKDQAARFYAEQMAASFSEAHRVLRRDGRMVVVYAHKTTLGWSTLVDSLRAAGFQTTEAWPLNTEMPERAGQQNKAGLASSIFLVSRKREHTGVGNYATEVRPEMVGIVERRVRELMEVGVSGADLVIACVGAGLRPYTRFDRVELPNGEELPSARFLDEVQREVLEAILAAVFHMDRSGVGQVDKTSRFYILGRYQYGLAAVDFGDINVLAQGLGIELSGAGSLSDGRGALVKVKGSEVTLRDFAERGADEDLGLPGPAGAAPLVDVLHRLLWLIENDRSKVGPFLDQSKSDAGRLRLLADALKGRALSGAKGEERTDEQKAIDRLLAQWGRVVESRAMPLLGGA